MEFHQLHYFVAVAEMGGFSKAAQRCNVAQPSLSQQIIKLEQELGEPLFERLGRVVRLTSAGHALLPRARHILAEMQSLKSNVIDEVDAGKGRLAVGIIPTIAPFTLPKVLHMFQQSYPEAELKVVEHTTDKLLEALVTFDLDVCFASLPINHSLVETEVLFSESLLLAIPLDHPLAQADAPEVIRLRAVPFIALHEEHCLSRQADAFCYEQHIDPVIVCRTVNLSTVQSCVAAGLGVALVPAMLGQTDRSGQCLYRPIADAEPQRTIVAAYHAHRSQSTLALAFVRCMREACAALQATPQLVQGAAIADHCPSAR
jgi:LysR family hydrogen peroxide-inducible transcriptional activator